MKILKSTAALVIAALFTAFATTSCNQAELEKLKEENTKLQTELQAVEDVNQLKDSTINDFFSAFNEIEDNLAVIREKEQGLKKQKVKGELNSSVKDQIIGDINSINDLMAENRDKINALNKKLKKANINVDQFEKMIANMQVQLEQKGFEITDLRSSLANANSALSALNDLYIESVIENEAKQGALLTAYYAYGSYKELRDNNVLTKEGGVVGLGATKTLKDDFNKDYFKKINIEETTSINGLSAKAKLVSTHPTDSYSLVVSDKGSVLNITNPAKFWEASKYLVILSE